MLILCPDFGLLLDFLGFVESTVLVFLSNLQVDGQTQPVCPPFNWQAPVSL